MMEGVALEKHEREKRCFEKTWNYINSKCSIKIQKYIKSVMSIDNYDNIIMSDSPDLIIINEENCIGLEHFMTDYCNDGPSNNQSKSRLAENELKSIYNEYHDDEKGIDDSNIQEAADRIQNYMNSVAAIHETFDYKKYCEAFERGFRKHYKSLSEYKKNKFLIDRSYKLGFLIEFHCDTLAMRAKYKGSDVSFGTMGSTQFPLTGDIVDIIKQGKDLDFVIVSQYEEGIDYIPKSVWIFEPNRMKESIDIQRIKVYDSVYYLKDKINIKLQRQDKS